MRYFFFSFTNQGLINELKRIYSSTVLNIVKNFLFYKVAPGTTFRSSDFQTVRCGSGKGNHFISDPHLNKTCIYSALIEIPFLFSTVLYNCKFALGVKTFPFFTNYAWQGLKNWSTETLCKLNNSNYAKKRLENPDMLVEYINNDSSQSYTLKSYFLVSLQDSVCVIDWTLWKFIMDWQLLLILPR